MFYLFRFLFFIVIIIIIIIKGLSAVRNVSQRSSNARQNRTVAVCRRRRRTDETYPYQVGVSTVDLISARYLWTHPEGGWVGGSGFRFLSYVRLGTWRASGKGYGLCSERCVTMRYGAYRRNCAKTRRARCVPIRNVDRPTEIHQAKIHFSFGSVDIFRRYFVGRALHRTV